MATLTLRPDAAGDETNWTPKSTDNYAEVFEVIADDDGTYVETESTSLINDLYNIGTNALLTGATINSVTVACRAKSIDSQQEPSNPLWVGVKAGTTTDWLQITADLSDTYATLDGEVWATNPDDSEDWEKADIDALQIGIRGEKTTSGARSSYPRVTQIWCVIDYTAGSAGPAGVKTINETAIASVKTINETAIASVKTINDSS